MKLQNLTETEIRELADIEDANPATVCNPHLGLEAVSLRQLADELSATRVKPRKTASRPGQKAA